ncbi:MAG: hypothetical protein E6Q95_06470 [Chitinophagaceae bacterium]|nr:MAG: hypothetical protein E6Q95_06470 [Chitinophagaceae bacterium]
MKLIISILATALLALILGIFLPWWSIALAGFIIAIIVKQASVKSFMGGLLGAFICWAGYAFIIDSKNQHLLSSKIGVLLGIGNNAFLLILVTGLVAGLVAGFAALTASFLSSKKVVQ